MSEQDSHTGTYALLDSAGNKIPLAAVTTVGREDNCDLQITEGLLSRQHARILVMDDGLKVEDLDSTNGTFINGERITGIAPVSPNDEIRFDTQVFHLTGGPGTAGDDDTAKTVIRSAADIEAAMAGDPDSRPKSEPDPGADSEEPKSAPPSWLDKKSETVLLSREELLKNLEAEDRQRDIPRNETGNGRLVGLNPPLQGRIFELASTGNGEKWNLGREKGLEITIDEPSISSRHFQIINEGDRWKVVNMMASNGTLVNGKKRLSCYLNDGDTITAGNMDFLFQLPRGAIKAQASPSTDEARKPKSRGIAGRRNLAIGLLIVALIVVIGLQLAGLF